jgi:hypothetical protein
MVAHQKSVEGLGAKPELDPPISYFINNKQKQTKLVTNDVWKLHLHGNDRSLHLYINSCTTSQEMLLQENQWTAIKRAEERKTCKRQESDRRGHRFRAGLGGSDAFVSRSLSEKP